MRRFVLKNVRTDRRSRCDRSARRRRSYFARGYRSGSENIKIIGINYGTLGFLTEYEKEETEKIRELLVRLKESNCPVLKRTLLETELDGKKYYALNEVSFQRDYSVYNTQLAKLKVKVNQREMEKIAGDGLLTVLRQVRPPIPCRGRCDSRSGCSCFYAHTHLRLFPQYSSDGISRYGRI